MSAMTSKVQIESSTKPYPQLLGNLYSLSCKIVEPGLLVCLPKTKRKLDLHDIVNSTGKRFFPLYIERLPVDNKETKTK